MIIMNRRSKVDKIIQDLRRDKQNLKELFKNAKNVRFDIVESENKTKQLLVDPITDALKNVETGIKEVVKYVPEETSLEESFIQSIEPAPSINLGNLASKYLPIARDSSFGIYYDGEKYMIGNKEITFDNDDIIMGGNKFNGTAGLWRLLTHMRVEPNKYTEDDLKIYKQILIVTDSMYQKNDKNTKKPKSSTSYKWKEIIKSIWDEYTGKPKIGSGVLNYHDGQIEYRYIDNVKQLIDRLVLIDAEERAGNNNFHNEKVSIVNYISKQLNTALDTSRGTEYLLRTLLAIPPKIGSGIFNDWLNKNTKEYHWPGYNYLGPGTHLQDRLDNDNKPINKLDEAAKEHDLFYREHKDTKDRHVADKVLQNRAWERVKSSDAKFLDEKVPALVTTGAMWAKRKLGFGITPKFSIV